ncbi:MAG: HNH endonuclease [Cetobacterium sp.]|uniref:HNH endonuclease n=1 Tax=Cetobacterium sp. TaxID=2071632 RepID=UPI003EE77C44
MSNFQDMFYYDPTSSTFVRHAVDKGFNTPAHTEAGTYKKKGAPSGVITFRDSYGIQYSKSIPKFVLESHGQTVGTADMIWHKDGDKRNNHIDNLEVISREVYYIRSRFWEKVSKQDGMAFITKSTDRNKPWAVQITTYKKKIAKRFFTVEEAQQFVKNNIESIKQ